MKYRNVCIAILLLVIGMSVLTISNRSLIEKTECGTWKKISIEKYELCVTLVETVTHYGLRAALTVFHEFFLTKPDFEIGDCHMHAHSMGQALFYKLRNEPLPLKDFIGFPNSENECSFKLLHGYFRAFFEEKSTGNKTLEEASKLCSAIQFDDLWMDQNLKTECFHGIGYGLSLFSVDAPENIPEAISSGLSFCRTTPGRLPYQCASGVYEGPLMLYLGRASLIHFDLPKNPYELCRENAQFEESCLIAFRPLAWNLTKDVREAVSFLERFGESHKTSGIRSIGRGSTAYALRQKKSLEEIILQCRQLKSSEELSCLYGALDAVTQYEGADRGIAFCENHLLTDFEQTKCYEELPRTVQEHYGKKGLPSICPLLREKIDYKC